MSDTLLASHSLSGAEGRAFATIDGRVEELFYLKNLEAVIDKQKREVRAVGQRAVQHKTTGWRGSGRMTLYYATSRFRRLMLAYVKTGADTRFDIQVTNEDAASATGRQTVVLRGVTLDRVSMARLDADQPALEEEVTFTFDDVDLLEAFSGDA